MHTNSRSIPDLIAEAGSPDNSIAGSACRELLHRSSECHAYIPRLIDLLDSPSVAIKDLAFRTLERIGHPAVDLLVSRFGESQGRFRKLFLGLISATARFDDYYPLLHSEIKNGEFECRYWAANCLGRNYNDDVDWPTDAIKLLNDGIDLLQSLRNDPEHWAQARITLKHLGKLPE